MLSCASTPPSTWTPLPPPLPHSPGAYSELLLVMESLPERRDARAKEMAVQVREGVVPEDVELSHRDLGVLLAADGVQAPLAKLNEEAPSYMGLRVLADAAILESRVHLAYGEGLYAWGALAPVLKIAGDLQAAGGGLLPFAVGANMERGVLLELEEVLTTPYGLGREGESALRSYLLARQAEPALATYAVSTECEATLALLQDPALLEVPAALYNVDETCALYAETCRAELGMMARPFGERTWVEPEFPSRWIRNRAGLEVLAMLSTGFGDMGRVEAELQVQRSVLLTAVELRLGHREAWPKIGLPTDPSTGKTLAWDGSTLTGGAGIRELEFTLVPAPPVWGDVPAGRPLSDHP